MDRLATLAFHYRYTFLLLVGLTFRGPKNWSSEVYWKELVDHAFDDELNSQEPEEDHTESIPSIESDHLQKHLKQNKPSLMMQISLLGKFS